VLEILGLGTAVLDDYAPDFFGEVVIRGAQLILKADGRLANANRFTIENGGTLFLDNSGTAHADRIGDSTEINLYAGTIAFDPGDFGFLTQEVGEILLNGGANQIDLHLGSAAGGQLLAEYLDTWNSGDTATLNIRYIDPTGGSAPTNVHFAVKDHALDWASIGGIIPWATITRGSQVDWVEWEAGVTTIFNPLSNYQTDDPANWHAQDHVLIDGGTASLINDETFGFTQITSLKLANSATLSLTGSGDWQVLELLSGGLLSTGANDQIQGFGSIGSGNDARDAFYIHVHGNSLNVNGQVNLVAGSAPMVKTGAGTLRLNGDVYMSGSSLVIHQGTVAFEQGWGMSFDTVRIGDGTGTDVLELPANHTNPLDYHQRRRRPAITLHGTPYSTNPDSGEFDAAILRFGGGTVQSAVLLHVEGRGTFDFVGGTVDAPNMLFLDEFTLADFETTMLFIRNWEDKHDFLLVRHDATNIARIDAAFLARINFEGYGDAQWVHWSDEFWEIKPMTADPEPATTGAILGAVGLGLVIWRRKRKQRVNV